MLNNYFALFLLILVGCIENAAAQKSTPIQVENADNFDINQLEFPDGAVLTGNVRVNHDGAILTCNKAYLFQKENYIKAFGNVQIVQGDTLFLNSRYGEYNGENKQAFATGDVVLRSPDMTLRTDTLNFDRVSQQAYYNTYATIVNQENTLRSKSGRYYANEKKFKFTTAVTLTNPKYVLKSHHLDYYNNSGHAYLFGPSTITSDQNYIYTEKGFYNSKQNVGHFLRKSYIKYNDRLIQGDSLYYDRNREFASATNNVKITDSINRGIVKGHYGEVYRNQDSIFVTKRAVAINLVENDSVYIHGKILSVTGKPENRIIKAYRNARFFKTDLSGKCDSIHSSQLTGITKLIGRPVLWNSENQMTGDVMHLIADTKTEKIDSLKVLNNAFIVSKDTIGTGFNQVKGQNLYGKFIDNDLRIVDILKNTEVIYYMRNEEQELIGINKGVSSNISMTIEDSKIDVITMLGKPDSEIYPEKDLPENARKLRGFVWRGDERIKSKDDIFPDEENEGHERIVDEAKKEMQLDNTPLEIRKETLDYDKKKSIKAKSK